MADILIFNIDENTSAARLKKLLEDAGLGPVSACALRADNKRPNQQMAQAAIPDDKLDAALKADIKTDSGSKLSISKKKEKDADKGKKDNPAGPAAAAAQTAAAETAKPEAKAEGAPAEPKDKPEPKDKGPKAPEFELRLGCLPTHGEFRELPIERLHNGKLEQGLIVIDADPDTITVRLGQVERTGKRFRIRTKSDGTLLVHIRLDTGYMAKITLTTPGANRIWELSYYKPFATPQHKKGHRHGWF